MEPDSPGGSQKSRADCYSPYRPGLVNKLKFLVVRCRVKYGKRITPSVIKSFNWVIKCSRLLEFSEAHTLKFLAEETSIPVPRIKATYSSKTGVKYIVMEYIPGKPLSQVWGNLASEEKDAVLLELKSYMDEVRRIKPPRPGVVAAVDYSPCNDDRISATPFGPFDSHDDFHLFLRWGINNEEHSLPAIGEIVRAHKSDRWKQYRTVLTHGDLAPRNIIMRDKKIVGIVDWETSGWFPEYWEYTRAWESAWRYTYWRDKLGDFLDVYDEELRIERMRVAVTE
jgi:hypothetical protein